MRRLAALFVLIVLAIPAVASAAVNDPYFSLQWGLTRVGAPNAWSVSKGAGQVVAVVDTGVDFSHPDLKGRLLSGHDFVDGDSNATDQNGHGTLIAGIIAAATDNGIGVASIAPQAKILPVRVLGADGTGTASNVADGIHWAIDHGADVINLSIAQEAGSDNSILLLRSPSVDQAIRDAAAAGAVVVIAAGNNPNGAQNQTSYDATTPGVVVVGASTKTDKPAAYSDYGTGLDLLAPGGGSSTDPSASACSETNSIVATWWDPDSKRSTYGGGCGSSMAVAFVSGVAALLRARGYSNAKAVDRILQTAEDIGAPGRDNRTGYGILDAARALGASSSRPAPKTTTSSPRPLTTNRVATAGGAATSKPALAQTKSARAPVRRAPAAPPVAIAPGRPVSKPQGWAYSLAAGLIVIVGIMHAARRLSTRPR